MSITKITQFSDLFQTAEQQDLGTNSPKKLTVCKAKRSDKDSNSTEQSKLKFDNSVCFSVFLGGIRTLIPSENLPLKIAFNRYIKGGNSGVKSATQEVRSTSPLSEKYKAAKRRCHNFTPHGVFDGGREKKHLKSLSGLFCFDLDFKDSANPYLVQDWIFDEIKETVRRKNITWIVGIFRSFSGIKILAAAPAGLTAENFRENYLKAARFAEKDLELYDVKNDDSQGRIAQPCYFVYDKKAVFWGENRTPIISLSEKPVEVEISRYNGLSATSKGYASKVADTALKTSLEAIKTAKAGTRNKSRYNLSKLVGGYVAAGLLSEIEALEALRAAALSNTESPKHALRDIEVGFAAGLKEPVPIPKPPRAKKSEKATLEGVEIAATYSLHVERYVSEVAEILFQFVSERKFSAVAAPAGSGKTFGFLNDVFKLLQLENEDAKMVLAVPFVTQVRQLAEDNKELDDAVFVAGKDAAIELKERRKHGFPPPKLTIVTYDQLAAVTEGVSEQLLIVDESHLLASEYSYRTLAIDSVMRCVEKAKNTVFLTATHNALLLSALNVELLEIKPAKNPKTEISLYEASSVEAEIYLLLKRENFTAEKPVFVRLNNKSMQRRIATQLVKEGVLKDSEIGYVYSSYKENFQTPTEQAISKTGQLPTGVKLVFQTKKLDVGVNLLCKDVGKLYYAVVIGGDNDPKNVYQFAARFRRCENRRLIIVSAADTANKVAINPLSHFRGKILAAESSKSSLEARGKNKLPKRPAEFGKKDISKLIGNPVFLLNETDNGLSVNAIYAAHITGEDVAAVLPPKVLFRQALAIIPNSIFTAPPAAAAAEAVAEVETVSREIKVQQKEKKQQFREAAAKDVAENPDKVFAAIAEVYTQPQLVQYAANYLDLDCAPATEIGGKAVADLSDEDDKQLLQLAGNYNKMQSLGVPENSRLELLNSSQNHFNSLLLGVSVQTRLHCLKSATGQRVLEKSGETLNANFFSEVQAAVLEFSRQNQPILKTTSRSGLKLNRLKGELKNLKGEISSLKEQLKDKGRKQAVQRKIATREKRYDKKTSEKVEIQAKSTGYRLADVAKAVNPISRKYRFFTPTLNAFSVVISALFECKVFTRQEELFIQISKPRSLKTTLCDTVGEEAAGEMSESIRYSLSEFAKMGEPAAALPSPAKNSVLVRGEQERADSLYNIYAKVRPFFDTVSFDTDTDFSDFLAAARATDCPF